MTTFNALHLNAFIAGYFEALYFADSATNCDGETVENVAGVDMTEEARDECRQDCARFLDLARDKVNLAIAGSDDYDHTMAGRDFWFSRQGHGVGFWDRGLGLVGDDLSAAARSFGEKHVFIDDDGLIGGRMMNIDMLVDFILSHGYGEPTPEGLKLGLDLMAKGDDYSTAAAEVVAHGLTVEAE